MTDEFVASSVQVTPEAPREREAPMSSDWSIPLNQDVREVELRRIGQSEDFGQTVDAAIAASRRAAAGLGKGPSAAELRDLLRAAVAANRAPDLD